MSAHHKFITVTPEQDAQLAILEQHPGINEKVRLRASIVRLNAKKHTIAWLVEHFQRPKLSVQTDLQRFEQHGIAGLSDAKASGAKPKITPEIVVFLEAKLELDQIWNCTLLAKAVEDEFDVSIKRDAIRVKLLDLGYSWKRGRFSPGKTADPVLVARHQTELEVLKKRLLKKQ